MKCLETRLTPDGFKRRRYDDGGVRFTTYEIPAEVLRNLGMKSARKAMEMHQRGREMRARQREVRSFIAAHMDWKHEMFVEHLKVSKSLVEKVKKQLISNQNARD